jgi:glycosyltransferase involved in cell wall biosynthesis
VVDNNSTDETALLARRAGAGVLFEPQQGYGYACMRGLREGLAREPDVVVLAEGDRTFAGRDLAKLLAYLDDADIVIGNRVTPGLVDRNSQMDSFFIWGNVIGGKLLQWKFWDTRFLGRTRLSDLGCTFRALRADALGAMIDDLNVGGHYFSPHMILAALRRCLLVVEVPVTFWPRVGASHGASQSLVKGTLVGLQMLWHILTFPTKPMGPPAAESLVVAIDEERVKAA